MNISIQTFTNKWKQPFKISYLKQCWLKILFHRKFSLHYKTSRLKRMNNFDFLTWKSSWKFSLMGWDSMDAITMNSKNFILRFCIFLYFMVKTCQWFNLSVLFFYIIIIFINNKTSLFLSIFIGFIHSKSPNQIIK